jgi:hypothetical protein
MYDDMNVRNFIVLILMRVANKNRFLFFRFSLNYE